MNRRNFVAGLLALATLPVGELVAATSTLSDPPIYKLKTTWSPELEQDLFWYHGLDPVFELKNILRHEIEQEIGTRRGTILREVKYHPQSFATLYELTFVENGKYGSEELWGIQL